MSANNIPHTPKKKKKSMFIWIFVLQFTIINIADIYIRLNLNCLECGLVRQIPTTAEWFPLATHISNMVHILLSNLTIIDLTLTFLYATNHNLLPTHALYPPKAAPPCDTLQRGWCPPIQPATQIAGKDSQDRKHRDHSKEWANRTRGPPCTTWAWIFRLCEGLPWACLLLLWL